MKSNLASLRKAAHMTQESLAEQVGTSTRTLSRWEKDAASIPLDSAFYMSQILHCTVDDIFGNADGPTIEATELACIFDRLSFDDQQTVMFLARYLDSRSIETGAQ